MSRLERFLTSEIKRERVLSTEDSPTTHYKVYRKQIEEHTFDEKTKIVFEIWEILAICTIKRWLRICPRRLSPTTPGSNNRIAHKYDLRGDDTITFVSKC